MIFCAFVNLISSVYFISLAGLIFALAVSLYLYLTQHFGQWEKKFGLFGLEPVPFFGTEKALLDGSKSVNNFVIQRYQQFSGHRFGVIYLGRRPAIFVRDHELLKRITTTDFDHFHDLYTDGYDSIADNNIFFLAGERWRRTKAALSQVFRFKNIKNALPKTDSCIRQAMVKLDSFAKTGEEFRMDNDIIEPCLLDCVTQVVYGIKVDAAHDKESEFSKMLVELQSSFWRFILLIISPEFMLTFGIHVFPPKPSEYFDKMIYQVLAEHRRSGLYDDIMGVHLKVKDEISKKLSSGVQSNDGDDKIEALTDEMIVSSCKQFLLDGIVTIASMLEIALFYMAKHPDIQEKAFDEIQNILGERMGSLDGSDDLGKLPFITDTDLMEMKYIEQVFNEGSRIASFPFVGRLCTKDYPVPGSKFTIPKGTPIQIPILGFHMDPELFPNPEKFDPERFSAENKGKIPSGSFIPFGQGPRICLGKNFISMEGRCFLANFIRSFKVVIGAKTPNHLEWDPNEQSKMKGGCWLKVVRRET